jgi:multidrug efflux system membrane fusion protein
VIAKRQVEVGQVVAAGQTVFTLAADGEREVVIGLPEQQFARFRVGQPVSVELWSHPKPGSRGVSASCRRPPTRVRAPSPRVSPSPPARPRPNWARAPGCSSPTPNTRPLAVPLSAVGAEAGRPMWRVGKATGWSVRRCAWGPTPTVCRCSKALQASDWVVAAGGHVLREGSGAAVDRSNRVVNLAAKE